MLQGISASMYSISWVKIRSKMLSVWSGEFTNKSASCSIANLAMVWPAWPLIIRWWTCTFPWINFLSIFWIRFCSSEMNSFLSDVLRLCTVFSYTMDKAGISLSTIIISFAFSCLAKWIAVFSVFSVFGCSWPFTTNFEKKKKKTWGWTGRFVSMSTQHFALRLFTRNGTHVIRDHIFFWEHRWWEDQQFLFTYCQNHFQQDLLVPCAIMELESLKP